jgi:PIN domain nuclease of toxin-antitoxin system
VSGDPAIVLDASAAIALLFGEAGQDEVARAVLADGAVIGAANWAEVAQKVRHRGRDWAIAKGFLAARVRIEPVTPEDAERAADLWTEGPDLSLGDRLCLALAARLSVPALTADRAWDGLPHARLIR